MSSAQNTIQYQSSWDNTLIFSEESDNSWLFPESTVPKPKYCESQNYGTLCRKLSWFKKKLESSLHDNVFLNSLLRDEYKLSESTYHQAVSDLSELERELSKALDSEKKLKIDSPEPSVVKVEDSISCVSYHNTIKRRRSIVDKSFKCVSEKCDKEYCSIDALALHVKRKHPELFNGFSLRRREIRREVFDKVQREARLAVNIFSGYKKDSEESYRDSDCKISCVSVRTSTRGSSGSDPKGILSEFGEINEKMERESVLDVMFNETSSYGAFWTF
jgi:hypothetical protein